MYAVNIALIVLVSIVAIAAIAGWAVVAWLIFLDWWRAADSPEGEDYPSEHV